MTAEVRFRGSESGSGDDAHFRKWLANLKQIGCNLLLTGEVPDEVSARATRTLFGRELRRFRVLALTDQSVTNVELRLPEDASSDDSSTWIIDQRRGERSVPATAGTLTSDLRSLQLDDVQQLRNEIQTAISFYDAKADGLDPAELRVGVDSLFPLLQEDREATERVLRTLGATVRGVQGMAHYHLRVADDDAIVEELMPLFDARIELRKRPRRTPEQRWYAPEFDAKTPWMEL